MTSNSKENNKLQLATFGAGCFWGVEELFRNTKGVKETAVGFMGGIVEKPSYRRVCDGDTKHAEVVHLKYNSEEVGYDELLHVFFENHDPTEVNKQGPDVGEQYRSVIFFHTPEQERLAKEAKERLDTSGRFSKPIATEIVGAHEFYRAEEYHQQYLAKRNLNTCHT